MKPSQWVDYSERGLCTPIPLCVPPLTDVCRHRNWDLQSGGRRRSRLASNYSVSVTTHALTLWQPTSVQLYLCLWDLTTAFLQHTIIHTQRHVWTTSITKPTVSTILYTAVSFKPSKSLLQIYTIMHIVYCSNWSKVTQLEANVSVKPSKPISTDLQHNIK